MFLFAGFHCIRNGIMLLNTQKVSHDNSVGVFIVKTNSSLIFDRDILLGASSWDSTKNFKDNLREAFVGGTMCVDFTTPQLTAYYKHLKEQYRASGKHTLLLVEVLGRQPDSDYWVLNKNVSICLLT